MPNPPSIPSHENVFGYEENSHGQLVKQKNTEKVYTGDKGDMVGPGNYEIGAQKGNKGVTKWHRPISKSKKVEAI